ncbi:uncharacterized protein NEMAJ01_1575 [Nematocida major]|uniref:uncharacterized protein n=1 Tax=Nematocida major TaxID=1912982 RepID=UPI00200822A9|nr:uncharacterized protein NEMAJ01_1575 [Nematocida major]KAH9386679.1 hypothetical protein NEMAJ01_1575 [Nematocida major]
MRKNTDMKSAEKEERASAYKRLSLAFEQSNFFEIGSTRLRADLQENYPLVVLFSVNRDAFHMLLFSMIWDSVHLEEDDLLPPEKQEHIKSLCKAALYKEIQCIGGLFLALYDPAAFDELAFAYEQLESAQNRLVHCKMNLAEKYQPDIYYRQYSTEYNASDAKWAFMDAQKRASAAAPKEDGMLRQKKKARPEPSRAEMEAEMEELLLKEMPLLLERIHSECVEIEKQYQKILGIEQRCRMAYTLEAKKGRNLSKFPTDNLKALLERIESAVGHTMRQVHGKEWGKVHSSNIKAFNSMTGLVWFRACRSCLSVLGLPATPEPKFSLLPRKPAGNSFPGDSTQVIGHYMDESSCTAYRALDSLFMDIQKKLKEMPGELLFPKSVEKRASFLLNSQPVYKTLALVKGAFFPENADFLQREVENISAFAYYTSYLNMSQSSINNLLLYPLVSPVRAGKDKMFIDILYYIFLRLSQAGFRNPETFRRAKKCISTAKNSFVNKAALQKCTNCAYSLQALSARLGQATDVSDALEAGAFYEKNRDTCTVVLLGTQESCCSNSTGRDSPSKDLDHAPSSGLFKVGLIVLGVVVIGALGAVAYALAA